MRHQNEIKLRVWKIQTNLSYAFLRRAWVITLWAAILKRLPKARLLLKYRGFGAASTQRRFRARFAAHGIDPGRLEFQGETALADMFQQMQRLDLALDPFPFSGGLMSCYMLWMGVPIITWPGASVASRQGLTFLSNIGITDTLATRPGDYLDRAVALAMT